MKKIVVVGAVLGMFAVSLIWYAVWPSNENIAMAQISNAEFHTRLERDKSVPKEKVDKAFAEAKAIHDAVSRSMNEKRPAFKLFRESASHLLSSGVGRLGETLDELTWRTDKTELSISIHLGLRQDEVLAGFRGMPDRISGGDLFSIPNLGDEAVLVKNVSFNRIDTSVGLHFVKGRAKVDMYLKNYKRKAARNEKDLLEMAKFIEPLIKARPDFDD